MADVLAGRMYGLAEQRLAFLTARVGLPTQRVLISIRDYTSFFISVFLKSAQFRRMAPFATASAKMVQSAQRWPDVVAAVVAGTGAARVIVCPYPEAADPLEKLRLIFPDLPAHDWHTPPQRLNASLPDNALRALQEIMASGRKPTPAEIEDIRRIAPGTDGADPFAEFSAGEARELQQRYRQDIEKLREMPSVQLIDAR